MTLSGRQLAKDGTMGCQLIGTQGGITAGLIPSTLSGRHLAKESSMSPLRPGRFVQGRGMSLPNGRADPTVLHA
jgi:hypothetical protein